MWLHLLKWMNPRNHVERQGKYRIYMVTIANVQKQPKLNNLDLIYIYMYTGIKK